MNVVQKPLSIYNFSLKIIDDPGTQIHGRQNYEQDIIRQKMSCSLSSNIFQGHIVNQEAKIVKALYVLCRWNYASQLALE